MNIYEKLMHIQTELKSPKSQYNSFGKYHYRNCEDILEAIKPLLSKYKVAITLDDDVVLIGERYYIKATATLISADTLDHNGEPERISRRAMAREEAEKKGLDASQISGSSSSYARKYALNGLLAIDDNKDADTPTPQQDTPKKADKPQQEAKQETAYKCAGCGKAITEKVYNYSKAKCGKPLCMECQKVTSNGRG